MDRLIIDPEFRDKIPPLTEDEFSLLEENILSDGAVFSPLIVWDGTILDGHNRYEALSWICKNQLGRRNLTPQQKKYLIGQRYEAEKMAHGGDRKSTTAKSTVQNEQLKPKNAAVTRQRIAEDTGSSESYVRRAGWYAQGVDAAEEAVPGIKQEILTGTIKPTETAVAAVAKADPEERPQLAAALRTSDTKTGGGRKKPSAETQYHTPKVSTRKADMEKIAEISAEMERPKAPATEESLLHSIEAEVVSFTELCDHFFREYPRLLSDGRYKQEVIRIMQTMKQYISKIEGGYTE